MPRFGRLRSLRAGLLESDGYAVERVWLETRPGLFVGGNLYLPARHTRKAPGVLIPHGHWRHGRLEDIEEYSVPRLGISLARMGCVAFAYDMLGYNDARAMPHSFGESLEERLWAFHSLGVQLRNSVRALDFLQALPEVDPSRLAVTGASGGGTQTFLLAAVDDRVALSCPVNMVSGTFQGDCVCENAAGLRVGTNNIEIAALAAPRLQLVISATGDWTKETPKLATPLLKTVYEMHDEPDGVESVQVDGPHNYNQASREVFCTFLARHWLGWQGGLIRETSIDPPPTEKMRLLPDILPPAPVGSKEEHFDVWKRTATAETRSMKRDALRARLMSVLHAEWPGNGVVAVLDQQRIVLSRVGGEDRVSGLWIQGGDRVAIMAHPGGAEAARHSPEARDLEAHGATLLLLDVFQTGEARAPRDRDGRFFLTFNCTDDACRVQDLLTALAWVSGSGYKRIELHGQGPAAMWCLFAKALAPTRAYLPREWLDCDGSDQELARNMFVPGLQYAGGIEAARRLAFDI
jgi:hypothetical protein